MDKLNQTQTLAVWILPVLFAITVHEVAHGWVAKRLGDKTAYYLGRLTLNPLKHIDPFGTVVVPLICFFMGSFIFGWAKPVPIDWRNLKHPRRDTAFVAAAGPLSNLFMALLWAALGKLCLTFDPASSSPPFFFYMAHAGISINLFLMWLNFLPIPPLDGSRVLASVLPAPAVNLLDKIEPFGFIILMILILTNILGMILIPLMKFSLMTIYNLFGYMT